MLTEKELLEMLSKSEKQVYGYIKEQCQSGNGRMSESMSTIGANLGGLSEATVHRAVRKLTKEGIIGISSSTEKAAPNEIVYYGLPDPDKQAKDLMSLIAQISESSQRFEAILKGKDRTIEQLKRDKEMLYEQIDRLELEKERGNPFDESRILSVQSLEDGTTAYLVRDDIPEQ